MMFGTVLVGSIVDMLYRIAIKVCYYTIPLYIERLGKKVMDIGTLIPDIQERRSKTADMSKPIGVHYGYGVSSTSGQHFAGLSLTRPILPTDGVISFTYDEQKHFLNGPKRSTIFYHYLGGGHAYLVNTGDDVEVVEGDKIEYGIGENGTPIQGTIEAVHPSLVPTELKDLYSPID